MPANEPRVAVEGSDRDPVPGARQVGPVPPDERIEVTIRLRAGTPAPAAPGSAENRAAGSFLTRTELRAKVGAERADVGLIEAFARDQGLEVLDVAIAERRVVLAASAARLGRAFGVELVGFELDGRTYRGRTGPVTVPASLEAVVEGVFGLDDRPQARPHFRILGPDSATAMPPGGPRASGAFRPATVVERSFTPPQIARLYDFVPDADGRGQVIALIELGGGFRPADVAAYFAGLGIKAPTVTSVSVDGGRNQPTTADSADGEVMLDIEVAGSVAPGAGIVVYFAPNTDRGFLDAISRAVHDETYRPSVISISWGGPESAWTAQAMKAMDQVFADAAMVGVTVTCASGDNGSDDRVGDGRAHADFPASSPNVLACGGTRIAGSPTAISTERTWNDGADGGASGGGISDVFALPDYQAKAGVPVSANPDRRVGRGVPDVAGDASPASGYAVRVDGRDMVIGGTSAVAPLYGGLVALLNERLRRPVG
ncbi:MAG: S53 family peptidase, partial [Candidatus Limnocylindrales bacterium]